MMTAQAPQFCTPSKPAVITVVLLDEFGIVNMEIVDIIHAHCPLGGQLWEHSFFFATATTTTTTSRWTIYFVSFFFLITPDDAKLFFDAYLEMKQS